ncbi:hypothetical protein AAMO2058_000485100 [Amorphochlora amoebiformis]
MLRLNGLRAHKKKAFRSAKRHGITASTIKGRCIHDWVSGKRQLVVPPIRRERSIGYSYRDPLLQEAWQKSLVHDLLNDNRASAEEVVPWFNQNMPNDYFDQLPKDVWYTHLRALTALFEIRETPDLGLMSPNGQLITFIKSQHYAGMLQEMIHELPIYRSPTMARCFTSLDCLMTINVFFYGDQQLANDDIIDRRYLPNLNEYFAESGDDEKFPEFFSTQALREYLRKCPISYLNLCSPQRFVAQRKQYERVKGNEMVDVTLERNYQWHSRDDKDQHYTLISIVTHNHTTRVTLETFATYMASANLDVEFLYADRIDGNIDVISILLKAESEDTLKQEDWDQICNDLERVKWLDNHALEAFNKSLEKNLTLQRAEILSALIHMLHGQINNSTEHDVSLDRLHKIAYGRANLTVSLGISELFERRFDPRNTMPADQQAKLVEEISSHIATIVDETSRNTLEKMLDVVKNSKKTNLYIPDRKALAISVDPADLATPKQQAGLPYGVFFVHGRRMNMFHARFREHSRGGMRVATPFAAEDYTLRSSNHYNEAYGLAATQQAKNKDIAEGGSKAVVLVRVHEVSVDRSGRFDEKEGIDEVKKMKQKTREDLIFRSVRMAADGLLDLIVPSEELQDHIVCYGDRKEYVYLGPDEQIQPIHINWITDEAKGRQLPYASAFMSSKPATGINHKEYGVTSEGVCIFMDVALKNIGLNPENEPFTLKMTGGPSGDVAGNAIKILDRLYKGNAKITGIVDHRACAEDPEGLNTEELLRLASQDLTLEDFDTSVLSSKGGLHMRETTDGRVMCDSMHNRLQTDAFLPAGGLPNTIRFDNWEAFLTPEGKPSSPLIVEAANIFIDQTARKHLTKHGAVIVKDSSANKCGVICSSMEIIANLLLSEDEFIAFKKEYVADVLHHLRLLAKKEADLMFNEYKKTSGDPDGPWDATLPGIAERISEVMNDTSDLIAGQLLDTIQYNKITEIAAGALLPSLRERAPMETLEALPQGYIINMVAKYLSSQLVYHEGIDYVKRAIPPNKMAMVALQYAEETKKVDSLLSALGETNIDQKEEIMELLRIGGPRVGVLKSHVFQPTRRS